HRSRLDMPWEIRQLEHRHHAIDGDDTDAVDLGVSGRRELRISREAIDVRGPAPRAIDSGLCCFERVRGQGNLRCARRLGESHAAQRYLAAVLPHIFFPGTKDW